MIDENRTLKDFGYTSDELLNSSSSKIWVICKYCNSERLLQKRSYIQYDSTTKCKLCARQGHNADMYGKRHTDETKRKIAKNHVDVSKENHPNWKGGKKMSWARGHAKRKQLFGFIPHNKSQENFHGHHLDFNHVIFIPKELHMSISHSVINNKNMDIINDAVCDWYLEYQIH